MEAQVRIAVARQIDRIHIETAVRQSRGDQIHYLFAYVETVNNKYPFTAKYDWFRFYKKNDETTYPCEGTPGCLPAADKTKSSQNNPKETTYGQ